MTTTHAKIGNWRNELLPNVVDNLAKASPDAPYALYPNAPTTYDHGYRTITYKDFGNAIDGLAWWLKENLGPSENFDVVAYMGPNDVRYTALLLGAIKAGYVAFFTSPRNSIAAHGALFDELKCRTLLTSDPAPPGVDQILEAHPMKHLRVPSVADLLGKEHPHYPFEKTFENARNDPIAMLHTSGSTGIPKAVIWRHESIMRHMNFLDTEPIPDYESVEKLHLGKRMLNTFPPFHAACVAIHIIHSIGFGTVSVAPLTGAIATAEAVVQMLKMTSAEVAFLVPSIVAELSFKPDLLDYCADHLGLILYAGGALPPAIGDKVASRIHMRSNYGASEFGLAPQLIAPGMTRMDWGYIRYHPCLGIDFEEITPGMFELVMKRDPEHEANQLPFSIGPSLQELQEYRTRDLFVKHPTVPDCWGWRARVDDIIVFLNGEKTNPVSMEQYITAKNENVSAVLVVGMQRFQAALLVETSPKLGKLGKEKAAAFIDEIWPSVEEANKVAPAHARVEKALTMLTTPGKPMVRSGKGTIQRQGTVTDYAAEIEDLYVRAEIELSGAEKASVDAKDATQVSQFVKQAISKIEPDLLQEGAESFFDLGMDSLIAMRIVRLLRHGLGRPELEVTAIYTHPSVDSLTQYIVGGAATGGAQDAVSKESELKSLLAEYESKINISAEETKVSGEIVILTGSTGSLGVHLLEALLANPGIAHIYCLNRRENAQEIHEAKAKASNFPLDKHLPRISFLHAILHEPNFGLDQEAYSTVQSKATLVVHNAWTVNFTHPLQTFRPQLDGLTNLLTFTSNRKNPAKLLFISSISSVAQLAGSASSPPTPEEAPATAAPKSKLSRRLSKYVENRLSRSPKPTPETPSRSTSTYRRRRIPEEIVRDFEAPYAIGYAQSKLLAELLCDNAAKQFSTPVSFARVGQIAGPVNGTTAALWNPVEWLPSLIMTSISLGALPDDLGSELNTVDWMPVDILAKVLVELGTSLGKKSGASAGAEVFNLVNPRTTPWNEVLPSLVSSIKKKSGGTVDVVPMAEWLERLRKVSQDASTDDAELVRKYPATKLQEFYEVRMRNSKEAAEWEMSRATAKSETLKSMSAVGNEWIDKWVEAWVAELK